MLKKHFRKSVLTTFFILAVGLMTNCSTRPESMRISKNQPNEVNGKTIDSQSPLNDLSKVETVTYCELVKNPAKYNHKIVRVRAIYFNAFERTYLYDETCEVEKLPYAPEKVPAETWAEWDKSFVSKGESEEAKLNRQLNGFGRKDVTLIGRFNSTDEQNETNETNLFGHLNCCQFQFQIMRLEKILPPL